MSTQGRVFSPADALSVRNFMVESHPALSPDGARVAYALSRAVDGDACDECRAGDAPEFARGYDVYVTEIESGVSQHLSASSDTAWSPSWSPDGERLAFYSMEKGRLGLAIWSRRSGQTRSVGDIEVSPLTIAHEIRWTPDSTAVVLPVAASRSRPAAVAPSGAASRGSASLARVQVMTSGARAQEAVDIHLLDSEEVSASAVAVAIVDVHSGKSSRLVERASVLNYWLAPDGKSLLYAELKGMLAGSPQNMVDFNVCSIRGGRCRTLVAGVQMHNRSTHVPVSWSPDGSSIAYVANGHISATRVHDPVLRGDCYVLSLNGGVPVNVTAGDHPSFESSDSAPLWSSDSSALFLIPSLLGIDEEALGGETGTLWKVSLRTRSVAPLVRFPDRVLLGARIFRQDGARPALIVSLQRESSRESGLALVDAASGAVREEFSEPISFGYMAEAGKSISVNARAGVAYFAGSSGRPRDIWVAQNDLRSRKRLTDVNPQLRGISFGVAQTIQYESLDGRALSAALVLPANYVPGKRYPLIAWVYSGTFMSRQLHSFGLERGDSAGATLNVQILASHGYAVLVPDAPLNMGSPALDLLKSVGPAVNRAVEMGIADSERCALFGHSFGGFAALSLITQTSRFRAAVAYAGIGNLTSVYALLAHWAEQGQGHIGGSPWQVRERYIENSPLFYLHRVTTPLLIVHGDADGLPHSQSDEIFAGLRRLGKEVTYLKYEGEGHVILRPGNIADFWSRVLKFYDERLKIGPAS